MPDWAKETAESEDASSAYDSDRSLALVVRSALLEAGPEMFLGTARELCNLLKPRYGMIYNVRYGFGPLAYAIGLRMGTGRSVQDWADAVRHGLYRFLRSVYRWNFLTDMQLNAMVNGIRLEEWIQANPARGKLAPFTDTMTLWTVEEQHIPSVREELDSAGMFFDYARDLEGLRFKHRWSEEQVVAYLRTGEAPDLVAAPPQVPPTTAEDILRRLGVGERDVMVLRVEEKGKIRELTPKEIDKIAGKKAGDARQGKKPDKDGKGKG